MNTCKNCKYWSSSLKKNKKGLADCDLPNCISGENHIEIEATAHDDSGLCVTLLTHEDFGCNMFNPKKITQYK